MSGKAWDPSTEYVTSDYPTIPDMPDDERRTADNAIISSFELKPKEKFLFLYDYGDDWRFEVQFSRCIASTNGVEYPRISRRRGESPQQYLDEGC